MVPFISGTKNSRLSNQWKGRRELTFLEGYWLRVSPYFFGHTTAPYWSNAVCTL